MKKSLIGSGLVAAMLLAGCAGLIFHAHDAQPMLIALAAYSGGLGALAAIGRKPRLTGIFYGLALASCLLGTGIDISKRRTVEAQLQASHDLLAKLSAAIQTRQQFEEHGASPPDSPALDCEEEQDMEL